MDNAICNNTLGSYTCQCMKGYLGEGKTYCDGMVMVSVFITEGFSISLVYCFTDIDECQTGVHNCTETEKCINVLGGNICRCDEGYRRDEAKSCEGWEML